jgi:putative selenate reductase molybdopterin-binding subunit
MMMNINLSVNSKNLEFKVTAGTTLLEVLRASGLFGSKDAKCRSGECGACSIVMDGRLVNSCQVLAGQAVGHEITTIESVGEMPAQGWKKTAGLDPIQQAFIETGAIQCGYCTPAMVLAARVLLEKNSKPTKQDVERALSGVLCRCTGYKKPMDAVLNAAAILRGEKVTSENLKVAKTRESKEFTSVGKSPIKVDAHKLVQGNPAFTADIEPRDLLVARVLHSPVAHARIRKINVEKAKALPGVAAVLTYKDIPHVIYSTAGQSDPIPGPLDTFSLDSTVRFVGDRVAFLAAENEETAEKALQLIEVEYEELPALLDSTKAMLPDAPKLHPEPEYVNFAGSDPKKNLAADIRIDIGDVEKGFKEADQIFEADYEVPKVQQAHIEPHVVVTWWDEDDRLVVRTSTQVPFHARRILAPVLNLPVKRIHVIKPRIGGGFGGKQEILIEDVAAHLTIATGRPVKYEYTREEEFIAARSRHPMKIHMKTGVKNDGTITANSMYCLTDTGAYGCHALTVTGNTGHKSMALYVGDGTYREHPNIRFYADIVYTNHPPAGAYRGYGVPQGYWAVERHMEKIVNALKLDPLDFRLKNALRAGEMQPFSTTWSEGREPKPETVQTVGLEKCVQEGRAAIKWDEKYPNKDWKLVPGKPYLRKGIGVATVMQGTAIPYLDMGAASIKINDDGSFNLLIGATDLGTGSDTVLAQMAGEVLGVTVEDIIVLSSDTDTTPFDKGAYASSTTYISGAAVTQAAREVAGQILGRAEKMFHDRGAEFSSSELTLKDRKVLAPDGKTISLAEVALNSLHHTDQLQIMATASYFSPVAPPPFGAQFAEVTVDIETGQVTVDQLVMAVDSGVVVNPQAATGQIEGGMSQALGYAVCEEMTYDEKGRPNERDFEDYHIFRADEMPELEAIFVESYEPSHPFGVKAVAEIPMDGVAPAVANAIRHATGIDVDVIPTTPERVWKAIQDQKRSV